MSNNRKCLVADFETINKPEDCRVWAWGCAEVGKPETFEYGNQIYQFMELICFDRLNNYDIYFHNLGFDGMFIMYWLFQNGFTHVENKDDLDPMTFTTLISDMGQFYQIEVCKEVYKGKKNYVRFLDSLKVIPLKVDEIGKNFGLDTLKIHHGDEFYNKHREIGHELDQEEIDYLKNDVIVMCKALDIVFKIGLTKMTIASCALTNFKKLFGETKFKSNFPILDFEVDQELRQAYKGGWVYCKEDMKYTPHKCGRVYDVNSLFPSRMYLEKLPHGKPLRFKGKYKDDPIYDLYIQRIKCDFELKEGYLPTIQIKHGKFVENEYLKSSNGESVELFLSNVDLEVFFKHYDVIVYEWKGGYKFKSCVGLFKNYIDYWSDTKIQSKKEGNKALYQIAKLMLNSLYGKFALNPRVRSKFPYYDKTSNLIKFKYGDYETRDSIYVPMGLFITAYARKYTIEGAQNNYDRFCYADTDSIHLVGDEEPKGLEVDSTKLGAWDFELRFERAKYLRQKCYLESYRVEKFRGQPLEGFYLLKDKITVAGMPDSCYKEVTFDNFNIGGEYYGKMYRKNVHGGLILYRDYYRIRENKC